MHLSRFSFSLIAVAVLVAVSLIAGPFALPALQLFPRLVEPLFFYAAAPPLAVLIAVALLAAAVLVAVLRAVWLRVGPGSWSLHARRDVRRRDLGGWALA